MNRISRKIKRLLAAIIISLIACFELCFTGRAVGAWRIARADPAGRDATSAVHPRLCNYPVLGAVGISPPSAPIYSTRLVIVLAIAVLVIAGALLSVESPDGHSFYTEDGIQGIDENQEASGTGKDALSSGAEQDEQIALGICILSSAVWITVLIYRNRKKPERKLDNNQ